MRSLKRVFSVVAIVAALCQTASLTRSDTPADSPAFLPDPCFSTVSSASGTILVCPAGDGETLADKGLQISVTVRDVTNFPIAGIPASDLWLIGCNNNLVLCGGAGSANADHATDANGQTTISGSIAAGGRDQVLVVVQGLVIGCPPTCLAIDVKSPDQNLDLVVDLADAALFATGYPPQPYRAESDLDGDGDVDIADYALFYEHFYYPGSKHTCF